MGLGINPHQGQIVSFSTANELKTNDKSVRKKVSDKNESIINSSSNAKDFIDYLDRPANLSIEKSFIKKSIPITYEDFCQIVNESIDDPAMNYRFDDSAQEKLYKILEENNYLDKDDIKGSIGTILDKSGSRGVESLDALTAVIEEMLILPCIDIDRALFCCTEIASHTGINTSQILNSMPKLFYDFSDPNNLESDDEVRAEKFLTTLENIAHASQEKAPEAIEALGQAERSLAFSDDKKLNYDSIIELSYKVGAHLPKVISLLPRLIGNDISMDLAQDYIIDIVASDIYNDELVNQALEELPQSLSKNKVDMIILNKLNEDLYDKGFKFNQLTKLDAYASGDRDSDQEKELIREGFSLDDINRYKSYHDAFNKENSNEYLNNQDYRPIIVSTIMKDAQSILTPADEQDLLYQESLQQDINARRHDFTEISQNLESLFQELNDENLFNLNGGLDNLPDELTTGFDGGMIQADDVELNFGEIIDSSITVD